MQDPIAEAVARSFAGIAWFLMLVIMFTLLCSLTLALTVVLVGAIDLINERPFSELSLFIESLQNLR